MDSHGLVLIDRFDDRQIDSHLKEKFSIGVTDLPYSDCLRLEKIVGFHYSAIGQSHFSSVIDIVLGSMRFAVNAFTRGDEERLPTARKLLSLLAPLFYRPKHEDFVSELSLFFSPKGIRSDRYRGKYNALKDFMAENGVKAEQPITETPIY